MRVLPIFFALYILTAGNLLSQQSATYYWHNPLDNIDILEGQGWANLGYMRLPDKAEGVVRDPVWLLSKHPAGLSIRFVTNADSLRIEYQVDGNLAMNHMPSTGVSGVDLYGKNNTGNWLWYRGNNTFRPTITFQFKTEKSPAEGREYQLYLPLYNNCKNLKVGIPKGSTIKFLPQRKEKPVVVYGTSIVQGACASRPGMAWTNILGRKLDYPVVNLGFSGNGRLEPEVLELITQVDAAIYVLDCLPNLSPNDERTEEEIKKRLRNSIEHISVKRPNASILLTQHAGYSDGEINASRNMIYNTLNRWTNDVFAEFRAKGAKNLFMLTREDINLSNDAFVDGTHPTDLGMEQYAQAYEAKLNKILETLQTH